ncbi:MAG: chemotaxis protein CheW [Dissulfurispiraceae bacterium]
MSTDLLQLVTFTLGDSQYAVDIHCIQEVNRIGQITPLPDSAKYVEGVINLRGKIIPIINLRLKFGLESKIDASQSRIIVVEAGKTIGMIVDSVSEVLRIPSDIIEVPPDVAVRGTLRYLTGIVKLPDRLISMLDVGELLGTDHISSGSDQIAQSSTELARLAGDLKGIAEQFEV